MRRTIQATEGASVYLLAICAGSVLSLFLSLALRNVTATFDGMSAYSWAGYAVMQAAFIAVVFVFGRVRRWDMVSVARLKKPASFKQFFLTPFIAIATILIFLPLANLWNSFLGVIGYRGAGVTMPEYSTVGAYFLSLFVMAVLPAFGEELLMRGGVFSGMSTKNVWFGVLISALLFSLMHANPLQTVHQFGLGVALALTVALTDSLFCASLVHFFNNFISITVTAYIPEVDAIYVRLGYYNWLTGAASVLVGLFMLVALMYALYRMGEKDKGFHIVSPRIDYDDFSIYVPSDQTVAKGNAFSRFFAFFASLFTKAGWTRLTSELSRRNGVELICSDAYLRSMGYNVSSARLLIGVWIAIGLAAVYWLYAFISGLV